MKGVLRLVNLDYLYNPETAKPSFDKNYFIDKKLGFRTIENGMILPHKHIVRNEEKTRGTDGAGGIINSNGEFIPESFIRYGRGSAYTPPPNQFNTAPKLSFI